MAMVAVKEAASADVGLKTETQTKNCLLNLTAGDAKAQETSFQGEQSGYIIVKKSLFFSLFYLKRIKWLKCFGFC